MKHTPTVRNYLAAIHELSLSSQDGLVSTGHLAEVLDVTPGTVTSMLKQLNQAGFLTYRPYRGVEMTSEGKRLAKKVAKRRNILKAFLIETLKLSHDHARTEAARLESLASDRLISHIEKRAN